MLLILSVFGKRKTTVSSPGTVGLKTAGDYVLVQAYAVPKFISCELLFFRHSTMSSIVQEERPASSPLLVARLHLPHAIVARLYGHKGTVVILTPETADTVRVWAVAWIFCPGCCPVRTTGGSLPCERYLLAPLTGNKEESKGVMVL